MREMSSNFCVKVATQIQLWVATKTIWVANCDASPTISDTEHYHQQNEANHITLTFTSSKYS